MLKDVFRNLTGRNVKIELALVLFTLLGIGLACGGGGGKSDAPKKPIPSDYLGMWTAQDGSSLQITNEGIGSYKTVGKSVDGAAVEVDEAAKTIKMTLLGFEVKSFKIDSPASGNTMKLDGQIYTKSGGSTSNSTTKSDLSNTSSTSSGEGVPSESETQALVKQTMNDFGEAVREKDFTSFHGKISETWQEQTTPEQLDTNFKQFVDQKLDTSGLTKMKPTISSTIDKDGLLVIDGDYAAKPPLKFTLKYIKEKGEWKVFGVKLNVNS